MTNFFFSDKDKQTPTLQRKELQNVRMSFGQPGFLLFFLSLDISLYLLLIALSIGEKLGWSPESGDCC